MQRQQDGDAQERLFAATATLLSEAPGEQLMITKLNKALFYFDLVHLRDVGEPFTSGNYRALEQGPVVSSYQKKLIKPMVNQGLVEELSGGRSKPLKLLEPGRALVLDDEPRKIGRKIVGWMENRSAGWVSGYSHQNEGWQIAYDAGLARGEGAKRIDLLIAMDQILEEDPWLGTPSRFDGLHSGAQCAELLEWT